jgi:GT2 family glycosyltransferase
MLWVCGYFLRRLVLAAFGRGGVPRALPLAEFKGALAGRRALAAARRQVAGIHAAFADQRSLPVPEGPVRANRPVVVAEAVRTVAVDVPLQDLAGLERYARVRVVLTRGGRPFGQADLIPEGDTVSALQLRDAIARVWTAALLAGEGASEAREALSRWLGARVNPSTVPSVTVVVPTLDRPDDLRTCLAGLVAQRYGGRLEVLVVDNAPESGLTPPVVSEFPGVRMVSEPRRGSSYARNAGIRASTAEICAMTDDDVRVAPDWLSTLVAPFFRPDVALVTGNVLPLELETPAQQLFESYGGLGRGFLRREFDRQWLFRSWAPAPTWEIGGTANAAIRTRAVGRSDIGLMPEWLGPGTPTGVGEDTYLFYRVLHAGLTIVYEPTATAWHRHRRDHQALQRQLYAYSTGHVAYFLSLLMRDGDLRGLLQLGLYLPVHHLRAIGRWLSGDRRWPASLIVTEIEGNLAGPWLLWRSVQRARRLAVPVKGG